MIYSIYAVKDRLTGFLTPSFDMNDAAAMRNFSFALHRDDLLFSSAPGDYDLYCLGTYDSETGVIMPIDPQIVCTGSSLLSKGGSHGSERN